jgi:hypothetical protein
MSDVKAACRAVQTGERTVEEVADEFRTRSWPKPATTSPATADEAFAAEQTDREPDPPGAFSEVAGAYYQGILTIDQYAALRDAAAEGIAASVAPVIDPAEDVTEEEEPETVGQDDDEEATEEVVADDEPEPDDKPAPGAPKKGVNPFPPKDPK